MFLLPPLVREDFTLLISIFIIFSRVWEIIFLIYSVLLPVQSGQLVSLTKVSVRQLLLRVTIIYVRSQVVCIKREFFYQ